MRLTLYMIVFFSFAAYSEALSQSVTLKLDNVSLRETIKQLKEQTGVYFVFNEEEIAQSDAKINLEFSNESFENVLKRIFAGLPFTYEYTGDVVIIKPITTGDDKNPKMKEVKGKVVDADSVALPGVSVIIEGTSQGVATDINGQFSLMLKDEEEQQLAFSFVGMKRKVVTWNGQDSLYVVMTYDTEEMDEVVVTGYQRIRKSDMVGSSNTINREDLFYDGTNTIEQMLQGKLPGVLVMNTSGLTGVRQKVRVRGTSTLLGNQEPVWVVDGIIQEDPLPFKPQELNTLGAITEDNFDMVRDFVGNAISWLNPNDIENITVLKDASATVMYGVKAANGVIVITTKRGEKGSMSINYAGSLAVTPRLTYKKMNLMNSKERIDVSREIYQRGLLANTDLEAVGYEGVLKRYLAKEITYDEFDAEVKHLEAVNTDWFDILFRNSVSMNHSISLSGGSDKISYYGSVNATINKGTSKGNETTNYSASVGLTARLGKKVTVNMRVNGSTAETKGYWQVDPYNYATTTSRAIPCYTEDGELFFYEKKTSAVGSNYLYNILHEISMTGNENTNRSLGLSASFRWEILKGLTFESTFGLNTSNVVGESWADEQSNYISEIRGYNFGTQRPTDNLYKMSELPHGGILNTTEDRNFNYTWRNQMSYNYVLAEKHRFSLMFGQEARSNKYDGVSATVYGYFPGRGKAVMMPPMTVMGAGGESRPNTLIEKDYSTVVTDRTANYLGYYASLSYGFNERYIVTGSFRSDASNRFGQDTKHRFLPVWSIGGRWNVHYEPWMQRQRIFSDLNFRVSYGWQGNVAENYGPDLIARMGTGSETIDQGQTGEYMLFIQSLPYGDLRWEKTKTINLGTDFGLFQNKITWTIEYYWKKTEDMIVEKEVPYAYGVTSMPINGGEMTNRGLEISFGLTPVRTNNFVWNMSVNTSKNFNKVESEINENKNWTTAVSGSLNKEGYPVSSFWAFEFTGLNPETGSAEFNIPTKEECPEGITDATAFMKYMGTMEPDFSGGLSMSFRYKTLSLSTSFNLNIGGKKFLYKIFNDEYKMTTPSAYLNLPHEMVDRWRKPGDEKYTNIPSIPSKEVSYYKMPNDASGYTPEIYNYADIRVVSASFFRCNSLSLNYTLPEHWVRKIAFKNLSISASVSNPFIIVSDDFKGMDPEVATGSQPISRTFSLGINISL